MLSLHGEEVFGGGSLGRRRLFKIVITAWAATTITTRVVFIVVGLWTARANVLIELCVAVWIAFIDLRGSGFVAGKLKWIYRRLLFLSLAFLWCRLRRFLVFLTILKLFNTRLVDRIFKCLFASNQWLFAIHFFDERVNLSNCICWVAWRVSVLVFFAFPFIYLDARICNVISFSYSGILLQRLRR